MSGIDEHRPRVFENRVLKKAFGLRGWIQQEAGEKGLLCNPRQIFVGRSKDGG